MKNITLVYFLLLTTIRVAFSETENISGNNFMDPALKLRAEGWMQNRRVRFLENKGQMADTEGNPVPFVLFKAEVPGMNIYITEKGIKYLFLKTETEDANHPIHQDEMNYGDDENKKVEWNRVDMDIQGASIKRENIIKETASVTDFNFFLGHCADGIYGVKEYEKITIREIYPGIDWVLYNTNDKGFKYDFIVHPKADPRQIKLVYSSLNPLKLHKDGRLEIKTNIGILTEQTPVSFYEGKEITTLFTQNYQKPITIHGGQGYETSVSFSFGTWDLGLGTSDLIIDPKLVWATFYGGSGLDGPKTVDCDINGNVFVTGYSGSSNFPLLNPGGVTYFQGTLGFTGDIIILKFTNSGVLLWATYYGGSNFEEGNSICIDISGNILITGTAPCVDLPVFDPGGGAYFQGLNAGTGINNREAFILKFDNNGARIWATYYGGSGNDNGYSIQTDSSGNIFVTGRTFSTDLPVTFSSGGSYYQGTNAGASDAFIIKFSNTGVLLWAAYYGGSGADAGIALALDGSGNVFVTGHTSSTDFPTLNPGGTTYFQVSNAGASDAFIIKFSNAGVLLWATYYGGPGNEAGYSICTDAAGNIFIIGTTDSVNLPVQNPGNGAYFQGTNAGGIADIFISKFNNTGLLIWATYYGGSGAESFGSYDNMVVDPCNNVYASFDTRSADMPVQNSCSIGFYDSTFNGGGILPRDVFIIKFTNTGVRLWASYFGGNDYDFRSGLAVDMQGNLFITGEWITSNASSYPLTNPGNGAYYDGTPNVGDDGYVVKFIPPVLTLQDTVIPAGCSCTGIAGISASGGCPPYQYAWYDSIWNMIGSASILSNLCAGTYPVIVKDTVNCIVDTAFVTVNGGGGGGLTLNSAQNNPLCNGDSSGTAAITTSGGTGALTYIWAPGGQTTATATGLPAGNYTVTVTDASGCSGTQLITIIEPPAMNITTSSTETGCGISAGTAAVNANNGTVPYTYLWAPTNQTNQTATGLSSGSYTVIVTDNNGCIQTQTTTIIQASPPNVTVTAATNSIVQGDSVILTAAGGGTYSWNTGETTSNITASPAIATVYCVTVTDINNCTDTACITIEVKFNCGNVGEIYLPNAFSPNGDGENDKLQLYYGNPNCISSFKLVIYNRWGEKVFETSNPMAQWDGSFRGKIEGTSAFVYYMEATFTNREKITKKGNISLIR